MLVPVPATLLSIQLLADTPGKDAGGPRMVPAVTLETRMEEFQAPLAWPGPSFFRLQGGNEPGNGSSLPLSFNLSILLYLFSEYLNVPILTVNLCLNLSSSHF